MKSSSKTLLAAAAIAAAIGAGAVPAAAAEFCDIAKTADGFIALRARPAADGPLVARMRPGDEVMINNTVAARNGWSRVWWWKGGRFEGQKVKGLDKASGQGWVNSKLLGDGCG